MEEIQNIHDLIKVSKKLVYYHVRLTNNTIKEHEKMKYFELLDILELSQEQLNHVYNKSKLSSDNDYPKRSAQTIAKETINHVIIEREFENSNNDGKNIQLLFILLIIFCEYLQSINEKNKKKKKTPK